MSEENNSTNRYDDTSKGGYSYEEKLNLVAAEAMNPHEIGLTSSDDAKRIIMGQDPPKQKLGDFVVFEASVVPLPLRAHWARKELKVVPTGITAKEWEDDWIEKNKNSHLVQGRLRSGTLTAMVQQEFNDLILGFGVMLRQTADMIEAKYTELKKTDDQPVQTRDELFAKLAAEQREAEEAAATDGNPLAVTPSEQAIAQPATEPAPTSNETPITEPEPTGVVLGETDATNPAKA